MGSPVRGNGPLLSAWVSRSPVVPSGWEDCPPIRHLAGRVQSLRGRVYPGSKMRPATSLTVFRCHDCEYGQSSAGQRGFRHAGGDGVYGLLPGVLVVLEYLAPDQAAGSNGVHEDEDTQPRGHFSPCQVPGGLVRVQGVVAADSAACRFPLRYCPARGGGRSAGRLGFRGQTSRRGVRSVAHPWIWARLAARL